MSEAGRELVTRADVEEVISTGRGYDRFVNFSDAVVAIAITLLGLPLVDIATPEHDQSVLEVLGEHAGQLSAFAYTFLVVTSLWAAHNRVFGNIRAYNTPLVWLNALFLAAIVFLPFPSEWVGEAGWSHGKGAFYLVTLAIASGSLLLIVLYARSRPRLLEEFARADGLAPLGLRRSALFTGFFVVMILPASFWPDTAMYLMLLIIPLGRLDQYLERKARAARAD
ncbi:MAG: TMEM175 family protein [Candidatus Nanopelagicales bacterium]